jgi:hypothetical protein
MQPQQSRKHGHLYATSMSHPLSYVPLFMRRCIATLEQRLDKTRALKQAMMQELLTGRTRLV